MGPEAGELIEVVGGVYAYVQPDGTWWVNNAGAVTGDDGTIVIDTCAYAEGSLGGRVLGARLGRWRD